MHRAQRGLKDLCLHRLGPVWAGRPAVLADPDRRARRDADDGQRLLAKGLENPPDRAWHLAQFDPRPEHVHVHVDARVINRGPEVSPAEVSHRTPETVRVRYRLDGGREPDRRGRAAGPFGLRRAQHTVGQRLGGAREVPIDPDPSQIGLSGDLYGGQSTTVAGDHLGHESGPRVHVARPVAVAEHQVMRRAVSLRDAPDPGKRHLGLPAAAPVHVHPRQQWRPIAAQLVECPRYRRRIVPPPLRHPAGRPREPERKYAELQRRHHAASLLVSRHRVPGRSGHV